MVKMSSEKHLGKKLVGSLTDTHTAIIRPVKTFSLKSSEEFTSRSLNVFNQLNALELDHKTWMSKNETHDSFDLNVLPSPSTTAHVFKKPFAPISRKQKVKFIPYKRNMKRWIKYSLKDIPISSDATNAAVALQFLNELRKHKAEVNDSPSSSSDEKVVFRKPAKKNVEGLPSSINSIRHHSKYAKKTAVVQTKNLNCNIKLEHLEE